MTARSDPRLARSMPVPTRVVEEAGYSRRVRSMVRVTNGVRMGRDYELSQAAKCKAFLHALPDLVFSHHTALDLLGVDLPRMLERDQDLHVVTQNKGQRSDRQGLVSHHSKRSFHTRQVNGLTVVAPERAWLDTVPYVSLNEAVVLADGLMRRQRPLTTLAVLTAEVESAKGARGVRTAKHALELARPNTDSPMETRTRLLIVESGLPCPEVNPRIVTEDGQFLGYADMAYIEEKVLVEFDGGHHRTDTQTWQNDIHRTRQFTINGWNRIQVASRDVYVDPWNFLAELRDALSSGHRQVG